MLIYEKNNKLNINFENNVEEQPDLQIGKSGDKTEVLIDGQQGAHGGNDFEIVVTDNGEGEDPRFSVNVTPSQVYNAVLDGKKLIVRINSSSMVRFAENIGYADANFGFCLTGLGKVRSGEILTPVALFEQFNFIASSETTYTIEYVEKIVNVNDLL